mgnify:CR=1 FL=1
MPETANERLEPQVALWRPILERLETVMLPPGYTIRHYREGDAPEWDRILSAAFGQDWTGKFEREMLHDEAFTPERVLFVCRGDEPVATSSAWYRSRYARSVGYLHWVAVTPEESGKGLGYQVSLACLHKMASEGRTSAMLMTDDFRLPAIATYLKLGFEPLLIHENQRQRWRDIFTNLGRPELIERFSDALDGPVRESPPAA